MVDEENAVKKHGLIQQYGGDFFWGGKAECLILERY